MMGTAEVQERIARLAALYKVVKSPALTPEDRDSKVDAQAVAQRLLIELGAEVLGAVFSIATSLEQLAECVRYDHPAAGGNARVAVERTNG